MTFGLSSRWLRRPTLSKRVPQQKRKKTRKKSSPPPHQSIDATASSSSFFVKEKKTSHGKEFLPPPTFVLNKETFLLHIDLFFPLLFSLSPFLFLTLQSSTKKTEHFQFSPHHFSPHPTSNPLHSTPLHLFKMSAVPARFAQVASKNLSRMPWSVNAGLVACAPLRVVHQRVAGGPQVRDTFSGMNHPLRTSVHMRSYSSRPADAVMSGKPNLIFFLLFVPP